jgi:PAS domain S-box-containing protein
MSSRRRALRITLAYAALAAAWIVVTDLLVLGATLTALESILKGLLFVAVTAALLQLFIERALRRTPAAERERAALQLAESETRFRAMVEQSISGIYVIQDGCFAYVNPRMAEIFGYSSADDVIGRPPGELVAAQDRALVAENLRRRLAGEAESLAYAFTGLRKDGGTVEVGVHGTAATFNGRPAVLGTLQDISERSPATCRASPANSPRPSRGSPAWSARTCGCSTRPKPSCAASTVLRRRPSATPLAPCSPRCNTRTSSTP